jgi:hypothetical protein
MISFGINADTNIPFFSTFCYAKCIKMKVSLEFMSLGNMIHVGNNKRLFLL